MALIRSRLLVAGLRMNPFTCPNRFTPADRYNPFTVLAGVKTLFALMLTRSTNGAATLPPLTVTNPFSKLTDRVPAATEIGDPSVVTMFVNPPG